MKSIYGGGRQRGIARFNENFVETFTLGQCLYDNQLVKRFKQRGSLGLEPYDGDVSAVVTGNVIVDADLLGSHLYGTSFNAAGIPTWWDTMTVEPIVGWGDTYTVVQNTLTSDKRLLVYEMPTFGKLFIDTNQWVIWVTPTLGKYWETCQDDYAADWNGIDGDGIYYGINLGGTTKFKLSFTYDGNDVSYDYYFHMVGRDNPNIENRKPEYYNNYIDQPNGLPVGNPD